jgi:hypothetical protein
MSYFYTFKEGEYATRFIMFHLKFDKDCNPTNIKTHSLAVG